jgi:hypothetical protein
VSFQALRSLLVWIVVINNRVVGIITIAVVVRFLIILFCSQSLGLILGSFYISTFAAFEVIQVAGPPHSDVHSPRSVQWPRLLWRIEVWRCFVVVVVVIACCFVALLIVACLSVVVFEVFSAADWSL